MLRSFSAALASPLSAHPTNQDHVAPAQGDRATPPARQIGIRQRSLRKHCRLGRATELVFITALGAAVTIGGGAAAQSVTYTNGQNRTDTLDTTGGIVLTVNAGESATQSGVVSGGSSVEKQGTGRLTLSGANTYTGFTLLTDGTLDVTGSIASEFIISNNGARLIVDGASLSDTATVDLLGTLELTGNETIGLLVGERASVVELGANTLTLSSGASTFNFYRGNITGTGGVTVSGGTQILNGATSFTGAINVTGGSAQFNGTANTTNNVSGGTLFGRLNAGANLTISGNGRFNNSSDQTIASVTQSGTGTLAGNRNLTISGAYDLSGGSVTNTATITAGTFTMSGGSINAGATVNSDGARTLSGGTIAGTLGGSGATTVTGRVDLTGDLTGGSLALASGATLDVGLDADITLTGNTLNNGGTVNLAGGNAISDAGAINNLATGVYNINGTGVTFTSDSDGAGGAGISNAGQFNVNTGGGVTLTSGSGSVTNTATGTINVAAGTTLTLSGTQTLANAGTIGIGAGGVLAATTIASTGTLTNLGTVNGALNATGGTVTNAGVITGATQVSDATLTLNAGSDLANAAQLTVGANGIVNVNTAETIGSLQGDAASADVNLNGVALTLSSGSGSFAGDISGTGRLIVAGANQTLSGANSYSGSTAINDGTLDVTGSIASSFLSMSGATSRLIVDGASLSDTAELNIGSGTLQLTGNEAIGSLFSNRNGTIELGSSTLTVTDGAGDFEGEIRGTGGLTVTGGDQRFGGTNSFTGAVTVTGGTALVDGLASTRVNVSGGRLSGVLNTAAALSLSGTGTFSNGNEQTIASVTQTGGTLSANRNLTVSGAYALGGGALTGTQTVTAGSFTMSGGSIDAGATVTATGARSLSGGTIAGTLTGAGTASVTGTVDLTGTLSGGALTIGTGGVLNANGTIDSATTVDGGTLTFGFRSDLARNTLTINSGDVTIDQFITTSRLSGTGGTVTIAGGRVFDVDQSADTTYAGVIAGTGTLLKDGTGTLTLSGENSFRGATTVDTGTLDVTGSLAASSISVGTGARLIVDGASLSDRVRLALPSGTLQLTGDETIGHLIGAVGVSGTIELGSNTLTVAHGTGSFAGAITGTGGVSVTGGSHQFLGTSSFTGAINVSGGNAFFADNAATAVNLSGGTLSARLNSGTDFDISGTGTFVNTLDQTVASLSQTGGILSADRNLTVSGAYELGGGSLVSTGTVTAGSFTMSGGSIDAGVTVNSDGARSLSGGTIGGRLGGAGAASVTGTVGLSGTLSGGPLTIGTGGVLNVDGGVLTADLVLAGGQLRGTGSSTLSFGDLTLGAGQTGTIAAADGRTLTLNIADAATRAAGSTLTFGEAGGTGVVTLAMGNFSTVSVDGTTQTNLAGGTVTIGNTFTGLSFFSASPTSIAAGATLDMRGNNTELSGLSGAGQVTSGVAGAARLSLAAPSGGVNSFSGEITDGAGTVSLFKSGGGTMILSGANGYSGTTTIAQGALQIGDGGTTGSIGAGHVTNNANLAFNRSDALTFGNVISGRGSVTQAGSGTTTLSGANSYAGVTQVNAGTLNIAHGTALGTTAGGTVVAGGATLALSGGIAVAEALTLNGDGVGGTGALLAAQGDNLLSGAVTLGSDTRINAELAHALRMTGAITGAGHALSFGGAGDITVSGNIATGTGVLTKDGAGTLTLSGENSFTGAVSIDAGTLSLNGATGNALPDSAQIAIAAGATLDIATNETIGIMTGAGSVTLSGGTLTLSDGADTAFAGVISGGGGLIKQGSGTLTLSGAHSFTGDMIVNAGRVAVDGSITAATTINAGGTLGGSGRVGAVTIAAGGTLAAGNSIGTLATGDLTFDPGSTLAVEVDPADAARADLVAATGSVTINGGTLHHVGEAGSYDPTRTWRVITATGGVTGTFDAVASDYTFLSARALYGADWVDLRLTRNDLSFASVARTRNQRATAGGLETVPGSDAYSAFATLSGDTARTALDQLSGAGVAAAAAGLAAQGQDMANVVLGQMTGTARTAGGATGGPTLSTNGRSPATADLWMSAYGASSNRDLEGIGTDLRHHGLMLGKDFDLETWQVGVFGATGRNTTETADLATTTTAETYSLGLHAHRSFGATALRFGLIGTHAELSSTRDVRVGALNETLTANTNAWMLTGFAEVSHDVRAGATSVSPFLRLTHHVLRNDGFAETGGTAALTQAARRDSQTEVTLGGHLARDVSLGGLPARLSADLSVSQQIGSVADARYRIANSAPFDILGALGAGTRAQFGLGLDVQLAPQAKLSLFAVTSRQDNSDATRLGAAFNLRF